MNDMRKGKKVKRVVLEEGYLMAYRHDYRLYDKPLHDLDAKVKSTLDDIPVGKKVRLIVEVIE